MLLKDTCKIFLRSKLFLLLTAVTYGWTMVFMFKFYHLPLGSDSITLPLERALNLSFYLFVIVMFLSYEYYAKYAMKGINEVSIATKKGMKAHQLGCAYFTMTLWVVLLSLLIFVITVCEYKFYHIQDPDFEYVRHIFLNIVVNHFLIMELASLIGLLFSRMGKRIIAYAIMLLITFLTSPYLERVADAQCMAGNVEHNIYPLVEFFNIMPLVHSGFSTIYSFGQSILSYRIFLILFWMSLAIVLILIACKMKKEKILFVSLLSVVCFCGYSFPASKVNMDGNPANTMAHDQYYYDNYSQKKIRKADFMITSYHMKLKIRRQLSATVEMQVSKSLSTYYFTLYHGYHLEKAYNQNGKSLTFHQEGDAIKVKGTKGTTKVVMKYEGYSPAYFSNAQGIFLPGDFAYYPRAGYIKLYDTSMLSMASYYVNPNTKFTLNLDYKGKFFTNLKKKNGMYQETSDGCSIFAGFYKEAKLTNGNRIIYNYLFDECYSGEKGLKTLLAEDGESLKKEKRTNTTIFVAPNVNQTINCTIGKKQIIIRNSPWY